MADGDEVEYAEVRVLCRIRPLSEREKALGAEDETRNMYAQPGKAGQDKVVIEGLEGQRKGEGTTEFTVSKCIGPEATQSDVFLANCRDFLDDYFRGYNVTVMTYGQTGAGKSYTMIGDLQSPEKRGLLPRCCEVIFDTIRSMEKVCIFTLSCSYLEIYMEQIRDLLSTKDESLSLAETPSRGVYVKGLTWEHVTASKDIYQRIGLGDINKARRATNMNPDSSRSHTVFSLRLCRKDPETGATSETTLALVDLAGCERVTKSGVSGAGFAEAKMINLSLTTLTQCVNSLASASSSKQTVHIPFRQSNLTRMLQDSLGGTAKTSVIVACSPHFDNIQETVSSLRFAQRCSQVRNQPKVHMQLSRSELAASLQTMRTQLLQQREEKGYDKDVMYDRQTQVEIDDVSEWRQLAHDLLTTQTAIEIKEAEWAQRVASHTITRAQISRCRLELDALQTVQTTKSDQERRASVRVERSLPQSDPPALKTAEIPGLKSLHVENNNGWLADTNKLGSASRRESGETGEVGGRSSIQEFFSGISPRAMALVSSSPSNSTSSYPDGEAHERLSIIDFFSSLSPREVLRGRIGSGMRVSFGSGSRIAAPHRERKGSRIRVRPRTVSLESEPEVDPGGELGSHAQLIPSEDEHLRKLFDSLDDDGNGSMDRREFKKAVEELGERVTPMELNVLLTDKLVDFEEFKSFFAKRGRSFIPKEKKDAKPSVMLPLQPTPEVPAAVLSTPKPEPADEATKHKIEQYTKSLEQISATLLEEQERHADLLVRLEDQVDIRERQNDTIVELTALHEIVAKEAEAMNEEVRWLQGEIIKTEKQLNASRCRRQLKEREDEAKREEQRAEALRLAEQGWTSKLKFW